MSTSRFVLVLAALMASGIGVAFSAADAAPGSQRDIETASALATMLLSVRAVISRHQDEINDPARGDKGLGGAAVLAQAIAQYQANTGTDPRSIDPASYTGRLLKAQMDAIVEVMDANQVTINRRGVGFKGFIPATFARLVNEAFVRRAGPEASMKFTAPVDLIRNRQSRPDAWEAAAIRDHFEQPGWPEGQLLSALVGEGAGKRVRIAVPDYYVPSCLTCHGDPKGTLDITGYPREGAVLGQLGGVISIELLPQ